MKRANGTYDKPDLSVSRVWVRQLPDGRHDVRYFRQADFAEDYVPNADIVPGDWLPMDIPEFPKPPTCRDVLTKLMECLECHRNQGYVRLEFGSVIVDEIKEALAAGKD